MLNWKWKLRAIVLIAFLITLFAVTFEEMTADRLNLDLRGYVGSYFIGEKCSITTISSIADDGAFYGEAVPGSTIYVIRENRFILNSKNWYCPLGYDQVPEYRDPPPRFFQVVPIHWGDRRYLLSEYDFLSESDFEEEVGFSQFCQAIERGDEPRDRALGHFYLMHGHWNLNTYGEPVTVWGESVCG